MAGDRIRIDQLDPTLFPSLQHVVAVMKDGATVKLTVEQILSLYEPLTSPTLDAPTIQNILTLADAARLRRWNTSDTDIDGLIPGVSQGTLLEGRPNGHLTLGVRGQDANAGLYVLDKGDAANPATDPYVNVLLALARSQFKYQNNDIWHAGNLRKGEELISNGSLSGSFANCEINLPTGWRRYRLDFCRARPAINSAQYFDIQVKGPSGWYTSVGNYNWVSHFVSIGGHSTWNASTFSGGIPLTSSAQPASGVVSPSVEGTIHIDPGVIGTTAAGGFPPLIRSKSNAYGGDSNTIITDTVGYLGVNNRIEAIRLFYSDVNIGRIEYELYGQR